MENADLDKLELAHGTFNQVPRSAFGQEGEAIIFQESVIRL